MKVWVSCRCSSEDLRAEAEEDIEDSEVLLGSPPWLETLEYQAPTSTSMSRYLAMKGCSSSFLYLGLSLWFFRRQSWTKALNSVEKPWLGGRQGGSSWITFVSTSNSVLQSL